MEIKPVITKKPPEYPTEYLFINNPELFKKYIPLRWSKNKLVCTALSVFIVAGTANSYSQVPKAKTEKANKSQKQKPTKENPKKIFKVAPIFVHGNGSGVVGCMIMSPPVFITENEAMQIISEELQKVNIVIDTKNCPSIKFEADAIANDSYIDNKVRIASINLKIDGVDIKHKFIIEYISTNDYSEFKTKPLPTDSVMRNSSIRSFRTKQAAEIVREEIVKKNKSNAVVFYDPIPKIDFKEKEMYDNFEIIQKQSQAKAKELLVAQVQDFINWLKTEGILK